jgi:hypothetical protein
VGTFGRWGTGPPATIVQPVIGVHGERRQILEGGMSPTSLGRRCAGGLVLLVLIVVAASPATAQTHAQTHASVALQTHA